MRNAVACVAPWVERRFKCPTMLLHRRVWAGDEEDSRRRWPDNTPGGNRSDVSGDANRGPCLQREPRGSNSSLARPSTGRRTWPAYEQTETR
jgi:hypothetical protein